VTFDPRTIKKKLDLIEKNIHLFSYLISSGEVLRCNIHDRSQKHFTVLCNLSAGSTPIRDQAKLEMSSCHMAQGRPL